MRGGFTLIETIVAVAIASIALMAVLTLGIDSGKIRSSIETKEKLNAPLMIAGFHATKDHSNTDKTLLGLLEKSYTIEHDRLKNYLEKTTIYYEEKDEIKWDLVPAGTEMSDNFPEFFIIKKQIVLDGRSADFYSIRKE